MAMSIGMTWVEFQEIRRNVKWYGLIEGLIKYANLYNFVDVTSVGIFVGLAYRAMSFRTASRIALSMVTDGQILDDEESNESMIQAVEVAADGAEKFRWWGIVGSLTLMFRFFKAFDSQPRLALVSQTFSACMIDVFHFLFVMAAIFSIFSIAAVIMFGHRLPEFVNFFLAVRTCLFIVMGEFEWEELRVVDDSMAFWWLILFFFVIVLLSLNMLLAIVFETYTGVRENIGADAQTLWAQSYETFRRTTLTVMGKRVTLTHIRKSIRDRYGIADQPDEYAAAELEKEKKLTIKELLAIVPGLKVGQLTRLLRRGGFHAEGAEIVEPRSPGREIVDVIKDLTQAPADLLKDLSQELS